MESLFSTAKALAAVRASLLGILLFGLVGMIVELVLLRHTEGLLELSPIVLLALAVLVVTWDSFSGSRLSRVVLLTTMVGFLASGLAGVWLHYHANLGYERDSNPGASTSEVYRKAVMGSTPTLAPGAMLELGLVGLLLALLPPTPKGAVEASKGRS
jgi:hypothetical protein